jgi:hypothetical protein
VTEHIQTVQDVYQQVYYVLIQAQDDPAQPNRQMLTHLSTTYLILKLAFVVLSLISRTSETWFSPLLQLKAM